MLQKGANAVKQCDSALRIVSELKDKELGASWPTKALVIWKSFEDTLGKLNVEPSLLDRTRCYGYSKLAEVEERHAKLQKVEEWSKPQAKRRADALGKARDAGEKAVNGNGKDGSVSNCLLAHCAFVTAALEVVRVKRQLGDPAQSDVNKLHEATAAVRGPPPAACCLLTPALAGCADRDSVKGQGDRRVRVAPARGEGAL